jgi:hypothetical protein
LLLEGYPARAIAVTSQINTIVPKLSAADDIKLVFLKYDEDHYFLREIYVGTGMGWLTPRSRTEREHVRSKVQFPVAQVQRVTVMASLR